IVGLGLGVLFSQLMSVFVVNMFEVDLSNFTFVISMAAILKSIIYFSIMYIIVMIFNTISISKVKLIDLLHASRKSQNLKLKNPIVCIIIFIFASIMLARAYYMVTDGVTEMFNATAIFIPIGMGIISTFLIFYSLSGLLLRVAQSRKSFYFKGLNSFTIRQFSSKINASVASSAVICLMLFLTISLLTTCLTLKDTINGDITKYAKADIILTNQRNLSTEYFSDQLVDENTEDHIKNSNIDILEKLYHFDFDLTSSLDHYIQIETYRSPQLTFKDLLASSYEEKAAHNPYLRYSTMEKIISITDYNKVAKMYGHEEYELKPNEFIIVANYPFYVGMLNELLTHQEAIDVFGHQLRPKYTSVMDGFVDISNDALNDGYIVVDDSILDQNYLYEDLLIGNYNTSKATEIRALEAKLDALQNSPLSTQYLLPTVQSMMVLKEMSVGLSAIITFIGLYLGIIFLISSAAILGLKELSESSDNQERFKMLRKLGTDEKLINKALFRQIGIFFALPLILAIIHSIFGIRFALIILEGLGNNGLLLSIITTSIFLLVIYGGYFLITYYSSKNIIKERKA
ncbi:MAG: ABC transporter permease, partial [Erysipelothrix sp.]|nr:ABC transporter permease [Erysipelothrix sp.]